MALGPGELYRVSSDAPEFDDVVLLHYLDGFIDAGGAGRLLTEHLLDALDHTVVATFDVDTLIDYRSRRPVMNYSKDHWSSYEQPELVTWLLHDTAGTPFLLLSGPEPDYHWDAFAAAMLQATADLRVRLTIGYHGIPMGVPHTRPLGVTAHATAPALIEGYRPMIGELRVPGSASALVELRMREKGQAAAGFAVHVPHYLSQAAYPAAALRLLEAVQRATGLSLPTSALSKAAERTDGEIARQVDDSEEVTELVKSLERQYDIFAAHGLGADEANRMPTAEEIGAQIERFLAEQQGDNPDA